MSRKVFISFLGTNFYKECYYAYPDKSRNFCTTKFIQIATMDYLCSIPDKEWNKDDVAYILLTDEAKKNNWEDNHTFVTEVTDSKGNTHKWEDKQQKGLKKSLSDFKEEYGLEFQIKPISIPNNDENAKWKLFEILSGKDDNGVDYLLPGDELYVDVTHGFRYLPMFLLVFSNYVKFLRNIEVRHISYGNYEGRNGRVAPIVDLTDYSKLQDWTYATRTFLETGNANDLVKLCKKEEFASFADKLKMVVADFQTCRSIPLVEGNHINLLRKDIANLKDDETIPPLSNVLSEIENQLSDFAKTRNSSTIDEENILNGYKSAIWCFNRQLYQQAITILQENLVTDQAVSNGNGTCPDYIWKDGYGNSEYRKSKRSEIKYSDQLFYDKVSKVRNDFDHAGFTWGTSQQYPNGWEASKVIKEIKAVFEDLIILKFSGRKKMSEKNGIPYIIDLK